VNRLTKFQFGATHIMLCTMCNGSERFYIEYRSGTAHIVPGIGNLGCISVSVKKSQKSPRNRKAKVPKFRCPVFRGKKFLRVNSLLGVQKNNCKKFDLAAEPSMLECYGVMNSGIFFLQKHDSQRPFKVS
jgi:hypothetical protein